MDTWWSSRVLSSSAEEEMRWDLELLGNLLCLGDSEENDRGEVTFSIEVSLILNGLLLDIFEVFSE